MNKIVAIDGPTASGKGTLAKKIASHFSLPYLNTGGLYRSVALYLYKNNLVDFIDENEVINILDKVDFSDLENEELYTENIGFIASKVAPIQEVRKFLFDFQRNFALQPSGAVLDGRDIGTVICPEARFKFYVTASVEERARRRFKEMQSKGKDTTYETILQQLVDRDKQDSQRKNSPLKMAEDAIEIDTTNLNKDEAFGEVLKYIDL
ncbi:MAG: (d)CMP kinase [Rickettsiales bacterium]|nr:(d)CMP kinase [Rickettsiales bacterium]